MSIFEAAKAGKCTEILKHVENIETLDEDGNTALMLAAMKGHSRTIKTLVRLGAKVDVLGKGRNSALSFACKAGHTEAVEELVTSGASPNTANEDGQTPLHLAVKGGHKSVVEVLLDWGADVNAVDKVDNSPLLVAVIHNVYPMIVLLLESQANPNFRNNNGLTPVLEAACKNLHQSVVLLLQHGADPNIVTSEAGNSALYWSSKHGAYATAKALLDSRADPCHMTNNGHTPLSITTDELMKRLIRTYQTGKPSWLVEQLCARGLVWPTVCEVEDKLLKEGFVTKELFLAAPMSLFTHEYLRSLGITHFGTRVAVITVRLEGTWLGARLAALGVSPFWIRSCETCVFEALGCRSKTAFANLSATALSAEALREVGVPAQYHLVLRALHDQLNKVQAQANTKAKAREEKQVTSTIANSTDASNSSS